MLLQMQVFSEIDVNSTDIMVLWNAVLRKAFDDVGQWRKRHKISCSQKRFKFRMVVRDEYMVFLERKRLQCVGDL